MLILYGTEMVIVLSNTIMIADVTLSNWRVIWSLATMNKSLSGLIDFLGGLGSRVYVYCIADYTRRALVCAPATLPSPEAATQDAHSSKQ